MLIDPTTAAATPSLTINGNAKGTTLQIVGNLASDVIELEISDGASGWLTWALGGNAVQLTATNMSITVYGSFEGRVNKPITTNAVGLKVLN